MRVPWTGRRSNQSILKEISPGISLEGLMLKLKLQYFGHLMRRVDSLEKTLMLGGIGGRRRRGRWRMRLLDGITDLMHMILGELQELVIVREAWRAAVHGPRTGRLGHFLLPTPTSPHLLQAASPLCQLCTPCDVSPPTSPRGPAGRPQSPPAPFVPGLLSVTHRAAAPSSDRR